MVRGMRAGASAGVAGTWFGRPFDNPPAHPPTDLLLCGAGATLGGGESSMLRYDPELMRAVQEVLFRG